MKRVLWARVLVGRPDRLVWVGLEFNWHDLWVGAFWHKEEGEFDLWLCLIPMLPLHLMIA